MRIQSLIAAAAALFLVFLLLMWLARQRVLEKHRSQPIGTPMALASPTPTSGVPRTGTATPAAQYRVAGIAVGDVHFVVVEHPDGRSGLYRPGSTVPGLGRVRDITETGATFDTPNGPLTLPITVPPPYTPSPARPFLTGTPPRPPTPPPDRGHTARGSSP